MYLVYLDKDYFGFTYSKKVVKLMKNIYPTARQVPVNQDYARGMEIQELLQDFHRIDVFDLEDKHGISHSVISTDIEIEIATLWINRYAIEKLSTGSEAAMELFSSLPTQIRAALGEYEPIDWAIAEGSYDEDTYPLTYEGYLLYVEYGKDDAQNELNKDLCLL